jgi:hypothetical protein
VTTGWSVLNPVLVFDVSVPSLLLEEVVAYVLLDSVVVLVLDVLDHEFISAETLATDLALELLVVDTLTVID